MLSNGATINAIAFGFEKAIECQVAKYKAPGIRFALHGSGGNVSMLLSFKFRGLQPKRASHPLEQPHFTPYCQSLTISMSNTELIGLCRVFREVRNVDFRFSNSKAV